MAETLRTTCPRDCYDSCGIAVTKRADGRLRVSGDPGHPVARGALCAKCGVAYNGSFQDPEARLGTPLRRRGRKGSADFEPVSWDDALSEIAERFGTLKRERGAESILTMHYSGTMSLLASGFPARFVNAIGASEVDYGPICNRAGELAWQLLFGTARRGFDPRTAKHSACILLWGANPANTGPHAHRHWLIDSPARVIVIDPVVTRTAKDADLHLQLRPGTDAALAFGLLNALRELNAIDADFVVRHTVGADELRPAIDAATPEWTEAVTGVPAASVREAAALYAAGPSLLWCGQGMQRQPLGGNAMRAAGLLPALTGNIGKPGAGFYYLNSVAALAGIDSDWLEGSTLRRAPSRTVGALDLAASLEDPALFGAFMVWNTNPLASAAEPLRLRTACARDDLFVVAIDLFMTDTARYADIVLPAASFLEFDDLTAGYFNLTIGAQAKAAEPLGEALPNQEIFRRLAAAMGLEEPALHASDESMLAALLQQIGYTGDFASLCREGFVELGGGDALELWSTLEFPTPSGRIEIASARAESEGLPRVPVAEVDAEPGDGLLRLLSPASEWRLNDTYANDPRLRRRSGPPRVTLHPVDAERHGVADGDTVRLVNTAGAVTLVAELSASVLPGTAVAGKGRWPSLERDAVNVNALYDGRKNDMGESSAVHGVHVRVERVAGNDSSRDYG